MNILSNSKIIRSNTWPNYSLGSRAITAVTSY